MKLKNNYIYIIEKNGYLTDMPYNRYDSELKETILTVNISENIIDCNSFSDKKSKTLLDFLKDNKLTGIILQPFTKKQIIVLNFALLHNTDISYQYNNIEMNIIDLEHLELNSNDYKLTDKIFYFDNYDDLGIFILNRIEYTKKYILKQLNDSYISVNEEVRSDKNIKHTVRNYLIDKIIE